MGGVGIAEINRTIAADGTVDGHIGTLDSIFFLLDLTL